METKQNPVKRIYEKPVLRRIELAAEEVLGNCKAAGVGPDAGGFCIPGTCNTTIT